MQKNTLKTAFAGLGLLALSVATTSPASAIEDIVFQLDFPFVGIHAPYYLALDRGYFKDAGANVKLLKGSGGATTVNLIASGAAKIGHADAGPLIQGVNKVGIKSKMAGLVLRKSPIGLVFRKGEGINGPKDLEGKTIGVIPGGSTTRLLPGWFAAAGINKSTINEVGIPGAAFVASLATKKVDAYVTYPIMQLPLLKKAGVMADSFQFADNGLNIISAGVQLNDKFMAEQSAFAGALVRAALRGWADARKDPQAAVAASTKYVDKINVAVATEQLTLTLDYLDSPSNPSSPLGCNVRADWETSIAAMEKFLDLKAKVAVDTYYTNQYLKGC